MAQITSLFSRPEIWLALLLFGIILTLAAWRLRIRWWPAWLLRLLVVGAVLLGVFSSSLKLDQRAVPEREIMVVDQSDSLAQETRSQAWQQAMTWKAAGDNRLVVAFGAQPEASPPEVAKPVDSAPPGGSPGVPLTGSADAPSSGAPIPHVDGRDSNLVGALQMAERLLAGAPGKIILATDGLASQASEVSKVVNELPAKGQTLDAIPLPSRQETVPGMANDLAMGSLTSPKNLWAGTPFDLLAPVIGTENGSPMDLKLKINGQDSSIAAEPDGQNLYRFHIPSLPQGMVTIQVDLSAAGDPFPDNNSTYTVLQVFAPPHVLFVSDGSNPNAAAGFKQYLTQTGIQVDTVTPDQMPTNLDNLQNYRVIFLDNLLSSQFSHEQMVALQIFVSKLAGGVVFLGGRNSYTLGGYKGTLLEPMLPVKLEPPPRNKRAPIVFQLILDRSSSMGEGLTADNPPIALAREAAMRAIETLHPEDFLGVLTFSDDPNWDVPIRKLGGPDGLKQAQDAISQVAADGSTNMYQAMQDALYCMSKLPQDAPSSRHILLLSDGQSTDGSPEQFQTLAKDAQAHGISISTIALGEDADADLMTKIAAAGKGRFYAVKDASDLPRILISESQAARSENVQAGKTSMKTGEPDHPILSGIAPGQLPTLSGYNALSSKRKEGAEDVLVSASFGDPVLSDWQYGLGRVIAWTGDIGQEWSGNWPGATGGAFWSQVVRYALVDPGLGPAQVNVQVSATRLTADATIDTANGDPLNLSEVTFTYADAALPADNQALSYRMAQKSAGQYGVEIPRPPDRAYRAILSYTDENGKKIETSAPFAVDPPKEWLPADPSTGKANLAAWVSATHGTLTTAEAITTPQKTQGEKQTETLNDWLGRLLLALVILWPLEIAIRRRWLPWN